MKPGGFMFIVGEPSGDTLGSELASALIANSKRQGLDCPVLFGAGGPKMAQAGVEMEFDLSAHAVVGILEVLKNYRKFKSFFDQLLNLAEHRKPDAIILVDYPGFNLRFAKALRERCRAQPELKWKPRIIYYVSPQIWAWHESRVYQIAKDIDLMLSIFPFEKAWYAERVPSFTVEYVGHPLVDRFPAPKQRTIIPHSPSHVLLLPGSRKREVTKHLPVLLSTMEWLGKNRSISATVVLPNDRLAQLAKHLLNGIPNVQLQIGGLDEALRRSDAAIAASGTVTMECAWFRVPTVVIYITSWSTYWFGKRFIKVKYLAMPNLLANELIFPEFIQDNATPENIGTAIAHFLDDPETRSATQKRLAITMDTLGGSGASERAADAILHLLKT